MKFCLTQVITKTQTFIELEELKKITQLNLSYKCYFMTEIWLIKHLQIDKFAISLRIRE